MNIIVTGASRGVGYEVVKAFSREPGHHILALSRNLPLLNQLKEDCGKFEGGSTVSVLSFDLNKGDFQHNLVPSFKKITGTVDILINNAGALINKPFEVLTDEDFDDLFASNVKSAAKMIRYVLPFMHKGSHIVNISSMGGFQGSAKFSGLSLYSASKGALAVLSECLAEEFRGKGISVNCLALGAVDTEMLQQAFPGYKAPLSPEEMAAYIAHFALHAHKYMNGKIIPLSLSTP